MSSLSKFFILYFPAILSVEEPHLKCLILLFDVRIKNVLVLNDMTYRNVLDLYFDNKLAVELLKI